MYDEVDKAAFIAAADKCGKEFPKDVFTLPSTRIMVAEKEGEIIMYQPQFISLVLGSLVPISNKDSLLASAQHMLYGAAFTRAHNEGLADIQAFSNNEDTRKFAMRHNFKPIADCLRMDIR